MNWQILNKFFARKLHLHGQYASQENLEASVNDLEISKSSVNHNHDDIYYTETEVDNLLAGKSDVGHDHDDRYYTETEVDNLLAAIEPVARPFFRVVTINTQPARVNQWTKVLWEAYARNVNNPDFDLVNILHSPQSSNTAGIWLYKAQVEFTTDPGSARIRFLKNGGALVEKITDDRVVQAAMIEIVGINDEITVEVYTDIDTDINTVNRYVHWEGILISPDSY